MIADAIMAEYGRRGTSVLDMSDLIDRLTYQANSCAQFPTRTSFVKAVNTLVRIFPWITINSLPRLMDADKRLVKAAKPAMVQQTDMNEAISSFFRGKAA